LFGKLQMGNERFTVVLWVAGCAEAHLIFFSRAAVPCTHSPPPPPPPLLTKTDLFGLCVCVCDSPSSGNGGIACDNYEDRSTVAATPSERPLGTAALWPVFPFVLFFPDIRRSSFVLLCTSRTSSSAVPSRLSLLLLLRFLLVCFLSLQCFCGDCRVFFSVFVVFW
jgi:hypothetical protein